MAGHVHHVADGDDVLAVDLHHPPARLTIASIDRIATSGALMIGILRLRAEPAGVVDREGPALELVKAELAGLRAAETSRSVRSRR